MSHCRSHSWRFLLLATAIAVMPAIGHANGIDTTSGTLPFSVNNGQQGMYLDGGGLHLTNGDMVIDQGWSPAQSLRMNSNQIWKGNTSGDQTLYLQYSSPGGVQIGDGNAKVATPLSIYNSDNNWQDNLYIQNNQGGTNGSARIHLNHGGSHGYLFQQNSLLRLWNAAPSGHIDFTTLDGSGTAHTSMWIDGSTSGRVNIGTGCNDAQLSISSQCGMVNGWSGAHTWDLYANGTIGMGSNGDVTSYISNASAWFGTNVYVSSGNGFIHASDVRLKENVETSAGLGVVEKLRGVTFDWKKNHNHSSGVIAQELETVLPNAVLTAPDGFKNVDYNQLVAPMIEAIKELKAENDKQAAEIAELKQMIAK